VDKVYASEDSESRLHIQYIGEMVGK